MRKYSSMIFLAGLIVFALSTSVPAATIGFTFTISLGNPDKPTLRLKNTSSDARLIDFLMTIGDQTYYFDQIEGAYPESDAGGDLSSVLLIGDAVAQDLVGTDFYEFFFTGFDPGDRARFYTEMDLDGQNSGTDCRTVFFNNGDADNAMLRAIFQNGSQAYPLSYILPDGPDDLNYYEFSPSQELPTVPIPGAAWLLGSGFLLVIIRRRRK